MAKPSFYFHFLIFFAVLAISITTGQGHNLPEKKHAALFIFGDSLYDAGNNNYLKTATGKANFYPYGETFFKHPTGRFSDGRIIPDFIAEYLKLPLIPPYLQPGNQHFIDGVNFASGGAGALVDTYRGLVIDLKTQLDYFKNVEKQLRQKLGDKETKALLSKAIFIFSVGSNDYGRPFLTNSTVLQDYTKKEFVGFVMGNLTSVLQEIYKIGGRKFGLMNLGALGSLPSVKAFAHNTSSGIVEGVNILAKLHNKALSKVLEGLKTELEGFSYSKFDFYRSLADRINNPSKYGFVEGKEGCCGTGIYRGMGRCGTGDYELCENPSEYVFFDGGHPTEHFNAQIAKLMWSGSPKLSDPYNLKTLLN